VAYHDFSGFSEVPQLASIPAPAAPLSVYECQGIEHIKRTAAAFAPLEWLVVALARKDTVRLLQVPGRIATAIASVFGVRRSLQLADPRLEALRRLAVLSWHRGYSVASPEVRAFTSAGFTLEHYESMMASIHAGHAARSEKRAARGQRSLAVPNARDW
jgi:hypothetical protein